MPIKESITQSVTRTSQITEEASLLSKELIIEEFQLSIETGWVLPKEGVAL